MSSSHLSTFDCYDEREGGGVVEGPNHMLARKTGPLSIIQYSLVRNLLSDMMQHRNSELLVQGGEQWGADREEEEGEAGGGEEETQVKLRVQNPETITRKFSNF